MPLALFTLGADGQGGGPFIPSRQGRVVPHSLTRHLLKSSMLAVGMTAGEMRLTAHAVAQAASNMPDYGFGRCDDHHKIVDFYSACVLSNLLSFLFKEPSSVLKGGEQGCQRQLVNEVLGPLVTEFAVNFGHEGATPTQPGFNARLLGRI